MLAPNVNSKPVLFNSALGKLIKKIEAGAG